jgi:hypothetical protein
MCSLEAMLNVVPGAERRVSAATKALPNANQSSRDSRKKKGPQLKKTVGQSPGQGVVGRPWPGPRCIFDPHSHSSMPAISPRSVGTYRLGWRLDDSSLRGSSSRHGSLGARRDFRRDQLRHLPLKVNLAPSIPNCFTGGPRDTQFFFFLSKYSRRPLSAFDHTQELIL